MVEKKTIPILKQEGCDLMSAAFEAYNHTGHDFLESVYEEADMITYTAKYLKLESGYMGQLIEWPEVVTEGANLDECRAMLRDALQEMFAAYVELGREVPRGNALIEQLPIEVKRVGQAA